VTLASQWGTRNTNSTPACFLPPSFLFSSSFLFLPCVILSSLLHHCLYPHPPCHLLTPPFLKPQLLAGSRLMPASSPFLLAPKGPPGDMGGPVREPALSVALWLSWGAALGAVACAIALLTQQTELQGLRREVSRLQRSGGPAHKGEEYPWRSLQEQVSEGR
jgi:hypothetical protein